MKRPILSILLAAIFVLCLLGAASASDTITYLDANGKTQTCEDYTLINPASGTLTGGWYVVSDTVTVNERLVCEGAVHLILLDDCFLDARGGIEVSAENASFTVYACSTEDRAGRLIANYEFKSCAAIGGGAGKEGHNITINGGVVTVSGGNSGSAGIGGGSEGDGTNITINGGTVDVTTGEGSAGIGGGYLGHGKNIIINGGTINVHGSNGGGAGIGGGIGGSGSNIRITGGTVTANGAASAAGIGGGMGGSGSNIRITGGTVTANGGGDAAGIGGGMGGSGSNIRIIGGTVIANGSEYAAGIGGGMSGSGSDIMITQNPIVTTKHGDQRANELVAPANRGKSESDGGFANGTKKCFTMTPAESATKATVSYLDAAGKIRTRDVIMLESDYNDLPGGWYAVSGDVEIHNNSRISCEGTVHLILLDNCLLEVEDGISVTEDSSLTIYAGTTGDAVDGTGELRAEGHETGIVPGIAVCYPTSFLTINGGIVKANSYDKAAGIGGNNDMPGYNITINGGTVIATAERNGGAGIGGGHKSAGYNITINGGTVSATGGAGSAGIGGGYDGSGINITVNGGAVTATGGAEGACGIGNGIGGDRTGNDIKVTDSKYYYIKHGPDTANAAVMPADRAEQLGKGTDRYFTMAPCLIVTFNMGGHGTDTYQQVLFGEKAVKPADPTDENVWFAGWYADSGCQTPYSFDSPVTADITVYAAWNTLVTVPTPVMGLIYKAAEQTGVIMDAQAPYTVIGDTRATNARQYSATFTLKKGYVWNDENKTTTPKTVNWEIARLPLTEDMIADIPEQTWTGKAIMPDVTVTVNGYVLTKGTDYDVRYDDNVDVGEATVTVTYAGTQPNLDGSAIKKFMISKSRDQQLAEEVIALIAAIGEVKYPGSGDAIGAARTAYDALTDTQKTLVTNYATLTAAETEYARLKAEAEAAKADRKAADTVIALIDAIGEVKYPDSGDAIDAARTAYDALTDTQKALVTNYATLTAAETEYARLKAEAEAAEADRKAAEAVMALIDAIGEVKYPDSGDAIDAARTAYDALTDTRKALVTNYSTLTAAEAAYEALKPRAYVILEGDGQVVLLDAISPAVFRGSGEMTVFTGIEIDGRAVAREYYSSESGSTIVRLDPAYIRMIGIGTHTLKMIWTNGSATANFTVEKPPEPPKTGDGTPIVLLTGLLALSAIGLILLRRRNRG